MANTIITPSIVAREMLDRLYESTQVAALVHRDFDGDFAGRSGDTITVRRPATFTANTFVRASGITVQDATEGSFTVALDTLLDVSFAVTAEELTLKLEEFSERFVSPAAEAIVQKIETSLLALLAGVGVTQTVGVDGTPSTNPTLLLDAAKILNDNKVPRSDRFTVLSTQVEANWMKTDLFNNADKSGSTDGLREAAIGRKLGFDNYASTNLPAGGESVAAHKTAAAVVFRTLEKPAGLPTDQYAVVDYKGFGLRVTQAYDMTKKQDVISVDCLMGVKLLDATRAVKILG